MKNLRRQIPDSNDIEKLLEFTNILQNRGWLDKRISRYIYRKKHPLHLDHFGTFSPINSYKFYE